MARGSRLIPGLRYRDAPAAIEFLCKAFGFERHLVVPGENNTVAHAQLVLGSDMIMLGSHPHEGEYGKWVVPPQSPEAVTTSGARIVMEPRDQDYGGRDYTCRDPEGYVWTFGTYDPWT